jgi:hypothetical protein
VISLQQRYELLFKAPFLVVFWLPVDLGHYGLPLGLAKTERAVALLPCKGRMLLIHPTRTVSLQIAHGLGQLHRWWQVQENMNVVCGTTRRDQGNVFGAGNSGEVSPQRFGLADKGSTLLGAEDAVH